MLLIELLLIVGALALFIFVPQLEGVFAPVERRLAAFSKHRALSVASIILGTLAIRAALLPLLPIPVPAVHDEFSYLLAADTFSHGRLANPTHPMWIHFETFHVNQKPTYVSMYYPAQGFFLAIGEVVFRHPFWGVWLSTGLMCGAICWMLQGWFPPFWALLGGILAVIRLGIFSYWMNSYWGGSVAALGGALVLGALPRIFRSRRIRDAVLMGVGFGILANSRPYEGLFFSIPIIAVLVARIWRQKLVCNKAFVVRVVAPLLLVSLLSLAFMGYYFWRTTGSPFKTPYAVNSATYRPIPLFPWQRISAPPTFNHTEMRSFYESWATAQYNFARNHPLLLLLVKVWATWYFYFGPALTVPFIAACFVLPYGLKFQDLTRRTQLMLLICASVLFAAALPVCFNAHYVAPLTCVFYAILILALQKARGWRGSSGVTVVRSVFGVCVVMATLAAVGVLSPPMIPQTWITPIIFRTDRSLTQSKLSELPGRHLVIVHYSSEHNPIYEWVYNKADIQSAKIVWARDMGDQGNAALIKYFHDRHIWRVDADRSPHALIPYTIQALPCKNLAK